MHKRIIAFDVGDKWIGVAHTDLMQIIVIPLGTWQLHNFNQQFNLYLLKNNIEKAIVGLPITLHGNKSEQTEKIITWCDDIKIKFPDIIFQFQDERLSSQFAKKILYHNKSKKNSDHSIAASIILENFLLYHKKL